MHRLFTTYWYNMWWLSPRCPHGIVHSALTLEAKNTKCGVVRERATIYCGALQFLDLTRRWLSFPHHNLLEATPLVCCGKGVRVLQQYPVQPSSPSPGQDGHEVRSHGPLHASLPG